ncbi:MAG: ATP-binding domain-containing protein, partial [Alphaproteobacteria bacterium]|nr:ATP-binding domain-containing protein [Alphaproteobacteria bacterium]
VGNILRFEKDFDGAKIIRLEQNYRSTSHILGASGGLIKANKGRFGKTLWTDIEGGDKVSVNAVWDGREEARLIGDMVEDRARGHQKLSQMAILVRAGFQTREFEERFLTLGVSYRIIGGFRFYERAEIRDVIAYLRHIANPDDSLAFERIINVPKRGIGAATVGKLHALSRDHDCSLAQAGRIILETDGLRGKAGKTLAGLLEDFTRWRQLVADHDLVALTEIILEESGYLEMWRLDKSVEAEGKLDNLSELLRALEVFEGLTEFLEHIALVMENSQNDNQDKISIMTLHGAKGLEFETVFLPGWEEELFPSRKSLEQNGEKGLEEERRLAYVGLTRAKKQAHIFHVASRFLYGNYTSPIPSRFISELPAEHVEFNQSGGMYGHAASRKFPRSSPDRQETAQPYNTAQPEKYNPDHPHRHPHPAKRYVSRPEIKKPAATNYHAGDRVFHDKFGYGIVLSSDGNKLEIDFETGSIRKLMDSFITAA